MNEYGEYRRGSIFYVESIYGGTVGSEQRPGRPAIIVSNDTNNEFSNTVEVVYLTTQPKKDLPTHVTVRGTGRVSTALCEQIYTVDVQRFGSYCGDCTEAEMQQIDTALLISLGLDVTGGVKEVIKEVEVPVEKIVEIPAVDSNELVAVKAQLSLVQQMYQDLLKQYMAIKAS